MASAEARLRPDDGPGDPVAEAVEGEGKDLGLHETQQEEPGSYRDAEHAPGGACEGHLTREAAAPERDECHNPEHEHHRPTESGTATRRPAPAGPPPRRPQDRSGGTPRSRDSPRVPPTRGPRRAASSVPARFLRRRIPIRAASPTGA